MITASPIISNLLRIVGEAATRIGYLLWRATQGFGPQASDRLLIAPQELETGDPSAAVAFYSGHIMLAGRTVQTRGQSPFSVTPINAAWARELHGFAWLRHFRDAENQVVRHHARALVGEWLNLRESQLSRSARYPAVVAQRVISWLIHAPLLLSEADHAFYTRFMQALARDVMWLRYCSMRDEIGLARLDAAIAVIAYVLCSQSQDHEFIRANANLSMALVECILADGVPLTRNPDDALRLAGDLLQLRTAYSARGRTSPPEVQMSLDRLMGFLRLIRHTDGALALFNGMGSTSLGLAGAIMAFDDSRASAPLAARFGGYQRVQQADAVVIADVGIGLPKSFSLNAHASALSFEFSVGHQRLVVNCGAAPAGMEELHEALRGTAAHSTLILADTSSARFVPVTDSDGAQCHALVSKADAGPAAREANETGEALEMTQAGYVATHGLVHRRLLFLAADGMELDGYDTLEPSALNSSEEAAGVLRFHLHPRVSASLLAENTAVRLDLADGQVWLFEAGGAELELEEDIFMGGLASQRRGTQIVVPNVRADNPVKWRFSRRS